MAKAKYNSPFSVGKRQTLYLDADDPRVTGFEAGISASRAGAEIVILNPGNAGLLVGSAASASPKRYPSSASNPKASEGKTPTDITGISAEWQTIAGEPALVFSFDVDLTSPDNDDVDAFIYTLNTGSAITPAISFTKLNTTSDAQELIFYYSDNIKFFGIFQTTFTEFKVRCRDKSGNVGPETILTVIPSYENDLPAPSITVTSIAQGYSVDWDPIVELYNYISVEEVISNASTDPAAGYEQAYLNSIKPAVITTPTLEARWVRARFTDKAGTYGPYSTAYKVTPTNPVSADNIPPDAPASGSVTAGIDNSTGATIGFNAYVDISWSAVSDATLKGYRIRFRENGTSNPYSYVDSPGTGTSFRLNGLSIGTTYQIGIASYDEFNNTSSSYTSIGTATASGTPFIGKNVTTVGYFGASATGDTGTFKFGYGVQDSGGTKRGLVFNSNNYWYIDSAQSALFKLGGDTNNYIQWDGTTFIIQGDLRAQKGQFDGNVEIKSGGSLYSGNVIAGSLSGAGFILNTSGLTFNSSSVNGITTINGSTGLLTTKSANIGGWDVTANTITNTSGSGVVTLDSTNAQIRLTSVNYTAGIATPNTNSTSDIVFWAGGARSTAAAFYVTANGILNANGAILQGKLTTGASQGGAEMKFGSSVGASGQDGLYINSTNYWYSNAEFSIGGGILDGTHDSIVLDLYNGAANFYIVQMPSTDDDGYAGDPTITIRSDGKITKGRRLIYSSVIADAGRTTTIDPTTKEGTILINGTNRTVKVGDFLFIDE